MRSPAARVALAILALVASSSCATQQPLRGQEVTGLDRKLSTFAFIEEGDLVSLIVGTKATRYREAAPYIPVEICVANRAVRTLSLTRESFTLVDSEGNRYPCAAPRELIRGYDYLDLDRRLMELDDIVFHRFANFVRYESKFSPTRSASEIPGESNLVRDRVVLPEFGYVIDMIYFPIPKGGLKGKRLELFLSTPELENPVFVKFMVQ